MCKETKEEKTELIKKVDRVGFKNKIAELVSDNEVIVDLLYGLAIKLGMDVGDFVRAMEGVKPDSLLDAIAAIFRSHGKGKENDFVAKIYRVIEENNMDEKLVSRPEILDALSSNQHKLV